MTRSNQFRISLQALAMLISIVTLPASASDADSPNDVAKSFYLKHCASCHGPQGHGKAELNSPALAGQLQSYLERQLAYFSSGIRGAETDDTPAKQMAAMASLIGDKAMQTKVSAYLSELPAAKLTPVTGDVERGYKYYQNCGSCHGAKAEGNAALNAPRLAGLSADYLKRQHQKFIDGTRGTHADDKYGRQMAMMAKTLTDEDLLNDVIAYIVSLSQ